MWSWETYESVWWREIHGPAQLCRELLDGLRERGILFFHHSGPLPWGDALRDQVQEELRSYAGDLRILPPVDMGAAQRSEQWFVDTFAPEHARDFLSVTALPRFLDRSGALDGKVLWLYGLPEGEEGFWTERLAEFAALPAAQRCVIVLEVEGKRYRRKRVTDLSADDYIRPFDVTQLCTMAVSVGRESSREKEYLSSLCREGIGGDPEALPGLLRRREELLTRPVETLMDVLGLEEREAVRRVRRAQLRLLLPLLEDLRIALLEEHADDCRKLLPFQDEFGNEYQSEYEMELRHLVYYYKQGAIYLTGEEWERVRLPYEARNRLMHQMKALDAEMIRQVLELTQRL